MRKLINNTLLTLFITTAAVLASNSVQGDIDGRVIQPTTSSTDLTHNDDELLPTPCYLMKTYGDVRSFLEHGNKNLVKQSFTTTKDALAKDVSPETKNVLTTMTTLINKFDDNVRLKVKLPEESTISIAREHNDDELIPTPCYLMKTYGDVRAFLEHGNKNLVKQSFTTTKDALAKDVSPETKNVLTTMTTLVNKFDDNVILKEIKLPEYPMALTVTHQEEQLVKKEKVEETSVVALPEENVKVVNDGIDSLLHATQEYCIAEDYGYFAPISSPGKISRARSASSENCHLAVNLSRCNSVEKNTQILTVGKTPYEHVSGLPLIIRSISGGARSVVPEVKRNTSGDVFVH